MITQNFEEFLRCGIKKFQDLGYTGKGLKAVILDDGSEPIGYMPYYHPKIAVYVENSHASGIARVIHEVAPDAEIISLPFIDCEDTAKNSTMRWLHDNHTDIGVINCSFHTFPSTLTRAKFDTMSSYCIPITAAVGNDGYDDKIQYPARLPYVIGVGALEQYRDKVAMYSNRGPEIDCLAPTDIYIPKTEGVMMFNGTSCSSAVVAGMLLLLMEHLGRKITASEAIEYVWDNCQDFGIPGFDSASGYGVFVLKEVEKMEVKLTVGSVKAYVDSQEITIDAPPVVNNGRILVPLRVVTDILGAEVHWDNIKKEVTVTVRR